MSLVSGLTTFGLVLVLAGAAQRLLGVRFGRVRKLAAGVLALAVAEPIMRTAAPAAVGDGEVPRWSFTLLVTTGPVLAAMILLVVAEALLPTGSTAHPVTWQRNLRDRVRRTRRYVQILRIAARHGLGRYLFGGRREQVTATHSRARLARALRLAFDDGGVTFVKLGQLLATRRDLLALEFAAELEHLHDRARPADPTEIEELIGSELGAPIEDVFAEFDPEPLAAASIAQVHAARLHTGERVVVKVQRPGIASVVERDLDIIERLAGRLESSTRWGRSIGLTTLASGFAAAIRDELDFTVEADNLTAVIDGRAGPGNAALRVPVPHPSWSGRRLLVMEQLTGAPLGSAVGDRVAAGRVHDRAAALVDEILRQIMITGVFHADPHPGNVLLLDDGAIGLVDFGSVGRVDGTTRAHLRRLWLALDHDDAAAARDALVELLIRPEDLDEQHLERELAEFMARHLGPGGRARMSMFIDLLRLVARHGLAVPPQLGAVFRTLVTLDGTAQRLAPGFDLVGHARSFATGRAGSQTLRSAGAQGLVSELAQQLPLVRQLPRRVDRVLGAAEEGRLRLNVRLFADAQDRRFAAGLLHQVLLTILCATAGLMSVLLLGTNGGPMVTPQVSLHHLFGYHLLMVSAILALRAMVPLFRHHRTFP